MVGIHDGVRIMTTSNPVSVLDHGFVRLVDSMGTDLSISRAARVSYDAPPREEDSKLIKYLMNNKHTTPFEAVTFTFEVKAPIFILRQWHRHRTWSYNEVSSRYTELPQQFYVPKPAHIGTQSINNKQMRVLSTDPLNLEIWQGNAAFSIEEHCEETFRLYNELLKEGVPRELARSVLPVATYSHMFATVDLHNLFHFLRLRLHSHAQYEIRVYAEALLKLIRDVVPIATKAFEDTL